MTRPKIIFLSANQFGYEIFKTCISSIDADFYVITLQKDSKVVMYDGIDSSKWLDLCSRVIEIKSIRANKIKDFIEQLDPTLLISCGWRQIIPESILNLPKKGCITFHPTPLPKGRGPSPIINSILEGWQESAVTMFYMDGGIDTGDVIDRSFFEIEDNDYAWDVYRKCITAGQELVKTNIENVLYNREYKIEKQDNNKATYFKKLTMKDNRIDISEGTDLAMRKIRAFSYPYLGAFFEVGEDKIIIDKARKCTKENQY